MLLRLGLGGTAQAQATGHHEGTGPVSSWVRPGCYGRRLSSLTVLTRSVVLWGKEATGQ